MGAVPEKRSRKRVDTPAPSEPAFEIARRRMVQDIVAIWATKKGAGGRRKNSGQITPRQPYPPTSHKAFDTASKERRLGKSKVPTVTGQSVRNWTGQRGTIPTPKKFKDFLLETSHRGASAVPYIVNYAPVWIGAQTSYLRRVFRPVVESHRDEAVRIHLETTVRVTADILSTKAQSRFSLDPISFSQIDLIQRVDEEIYLDNPQFILDSDEARGCIARFLHAYLLLRDAYQQPIGYVSSYPISIETANKLFAMPLDGRELRLPSTRYAERVFSSKEALSEVELEAMSAYAWYVDNVAVIPSAPAAAALNMMTMYCEWFAGFARKARMIVMPTVTSGDFGEPLIRNCNFLFGVYGFSAFADRWADHSASGELPRPKCWVAEKVTFAS